MDLFKWVGRKKREEEWMAQPRRTPAFAEGLAQADGRWLVTQEFVNDEDKNMRCYLAMFQPDGKNERWKIYQVEYDLKRDYVGSSIFDETSDPMEVVKALHDYERKMKKSEFFISHPDHRADYRPFANKYGIHFDEDGNVFRVETEAPLATGTFMNRESIDKLFRKEASKTLPLDSWEGIYKEIVEARAPDWTSTERGFGMPEDFQGVGAVVDETQPAASPVSIEPSASNVWEMAAAGGGVIKWNGGVGSVPTAKDVAEAMEQLASGAAFKPRIEANADVKPASEVPAEKAPEGAPPAEKPLAATVSPGDAPASAPAPEKTVLPPLPVQVNGKFVFIHAREKTWSGYKEMKRVTWQRPLTLDDLAADRAYAQYGTSMNYLMDKLKALPELLTGKADKYSKEAEIKGLARFAFDARYAGNLEKLAKHECDATILVGLLRAGNAVYNEQFGPGKKFSPEGLQMVSTIGNVCTQFAIERLGVSSDEAKKIADVITKGKDPFGAELPLEKTFRKLPPPALAPAPVPKDDVAHAPKKKPTIKKKA